jgi:hypothetical protein
MINFQILILIIISFIFSIALLIFLSGHTHLILYNKTTIETLEKQGKNIYDLGIKSNWTHTMGSNWKLWFLPIHDNNRDYLVNDSMRNGYEFIVNHNHNQLDSIDNDQLEFDDFIN